MTSENSMSRSCEMLLTLVLIMGWDMKGNTVPRARCQERYSGGGCEEENSTHYLYHYFMFREKAVCRLPNSQGHIPMALDKLGKKT